MRIAKADLVPTDANLLPAYRSFADLAGACERFVKKVNAREHRGTARVPEEMLARERAALSRLPQAPFTSAFGTTRRANRTSLISYGGAQYSVPHAFSEETVWVRVDGDELVVVGREDAGLGEIARHRCALPGRRVIDPSHFPAAPPGPLRRRPRPRSEREREFLQIGGSAERWLLKAAQSGAGRLGSKLDEIVALARLHGRAEVDRALGIAAEHDRFGFGDVGSILQTGSTGTLRRAPESAFMPASTSGWDNFGIGAGR